MVGVIFLLYTDDQVDNLFIDILREDFKFSVTNYPFLTVDQVKRMSIDNDYLQSLKSQIIEQTLQIHKDVKKNWKSNHVVYPLYFKEQVELAVNRTYYLPFKIQVPIMKRFALVPRQISLEDYLCFEDMVASFDSR